ncbi:unannotated protein [freshwater metagenome]|uniref:Unannotated protein n=1 Tax=freshwater metagenome TaxID=449393 RepID=A0A6J7F3S2_9ZZZZ|nr:Stp1/IreP family PP2C-type Ser/Thr phosphatase [Actinomycetota bacterium]
MPELRWGAATDRGRVRPENEDTFVAEPMIFAVADGMGGHQAGEVASALAASILRERLGGGAASEAAAESAVSEANAAIFGAARANTTQRGMGTTLTALAVLHAEGDGDERLALVNVGDSRTYRYRLGRLQRMTVDHSYVQELVATGHISDEEARTHPRRNIVTRALGINAVVRADVWSLPIVRGDRFVLCSDGLVDEVPDHEIADLVGAVADPQLLAEVLVEMANRHGGRDNITVVVVDVVVGEEPPDPTDEISFDPAWAEGAEEPAAWADDATVATAIVVGDGHETDPVLSGAATAPIAALDATTTPRPRRKWLTVGTFFFAFALALIATISITLIAVHERSGYFVGFDGDTVVVYKGQRDSLLWFDPTVDATSTRTRQDLDPTMVDVINTRPVFDTADQAAQFIATQVTPTTTTTTTTSTTSTTVAPSSTTGVTGTSVAGP